jgi:hypothetical protein
MTGRSGRDEAARGSVTAEFAALLPALALLLAAVLAAGTAAVAQVRCVDAARTGARLAARHESGPAVLAAALAAGPRGARVTVTAAGPLVRVRVSAGVGLPLPGHPALTVEATSAARLEEPAG